MRLFITRHRKTCIRLLIALSALGLSVPIVAGACADNETRQCIGPACACVFDATKDRAIRDAAEAVRKAGQGTVDFSQKAIQSCLAKPLQCPADVIKGAPAELVRPVVAAYKNHLISQANDRGWLSLPDWFREDFAAQYPELDLSSIRYATNIDTIHGSAITLCQWVYFPRSIDLFDRSDKMWMLHELEHSVQCARKGGEDNFLSEYIAHSVGTIASCKCINIHDEISLERAAISKASVVTDSYGWNFHFKNECTALVYVLVKYLSTDGEWTSRGWFKFDGGGENFLYGVHSTNRIFYWHAQSFGPDVKGLGDSSITYQGQDYRAVKVYININSERFDFGARCN